MELQSTERVVVGWIQNRRFAALLMYMQTPNHLELSESSVVPEDNDGSLIFSG